MRQSPRVAVTAAHSSCDVARLVSLLRPAYVVPLFETPAQCAWHMNLRTADQITLRRWPGAFFALAADSSWPLLSPLVGRLHLSRGPDGRRVPMRRQSRWLRPQVVEGSWRTSTRVSSISAPTIETSAAELLHRAAATPNVSNPPLSLLASRRICSWISSSTCGETKGPSDLPTSSVTFPQGKKLASASRKRTAGKSARKKYTPAAPRARGHHHRALHPTYGDLSQTTTARRS